MFREPVTPENVENHIKHLVDYMGQQLDALATPTEEKSRDRIVSARIAHSVLTQVYDAMLVRAPWLRDAEQVAAVIGSMADHALKAGYGRMQAAYHDGSLAVHVVEWMQLQPTTLKVGVAMGRSRDSETLPLPEEWWTMSIAEKTQWADEALEDHVSDNVDSWWTLVDANGEVTADQLDPIASGVPEETE